MIDYIIFYDASSSSIHHLRPPAGHRCPPLNEREDLDYNEPAGSVRPGDFRYPLNFFTCAHIILSFTLKLGIYTSNNTLRNSNVNVT